MEFSSSSPILSLKKACSGLLNNFIQQEYKQQMRVLKQKKINQIREIVMQLKMMDESTYFQEDSLQYHTKYVTQKIQKTPTKCQDRIKHSFITKFNKKGNNKDEFREKSSNKKKELLKPKQLTNIDIFRI